MVTFSDDRVGDSFVVPPRVAVALLDALVRAGASLAAARWEHDLIAWLGDRRRGLAIGARAGLDLGEVAWTPEHFAEQQRFVIALCEAVDPLSAEVATAAATLRELASRRNREHVLVARRFISKFA